ncbi:hypothetical protein D1609_06015 [Leptospira borgpetersenii serovar Hardjo-bovis]|nr:hypothetical protein D1609_06015 [Leptospira borgpetersenii serovar Hardjo-bovis]
MHRTLKAEAVYPIRSLMNQRQKPFGRFRTEYNFRTSSIYAFVQENSSRLAPSYMYLMSSPSAILSHKTIKFKLTKRRILTHS